MEIKLTAERIREAAAGCPDAERVLKTLAPEAFETDKGEGIRSRLRHGTITRTETERFIWLMPEKVEAAIRLTRARGVNLFYVKIAGYADVGTCGVAIGPQEEIEK